MSTAAWIVVAVVVVVVLVAVVAALTVGRRRRSQARREEAGELRERARAADVTVQRREAEAAEAQAKARAAQAEADARAAQAAQLQADAQQRSEHAQSSRNELDDQLRHADEIDPDVPADDSTDSAGEAGIHRADDSAAAEPAPGQRGPDDELRHMDLTEGQRYEGAHTQRDRPYGAPQA